MYDFKSKRKIQRRLYSKVSIVVLAIIVLILGKATFNIYRKSAESRDNLHKAETEQKKLLEKEEVLTKDIMRLKSEKGRDEEIRGKFSVVKNGENVVVIVEDDKNNQKNDASQGGFFAKLWHKIVSIF
jgi:hypothetical protein